MVATINEIIAAIWNSRGKYLATVIAHLVEDEPIRKRLKDHSLIKGVIDSQPPSYIPTKAFALAMLDAIHPLDAATVRTPTDLANALDAIVTPSMRRALLPLSADAGGDLSEFVKRLEDWFDSGMTRASAWYKRNTQ